MTRNSMIILYNVRQSILYTIAVVRYYMYTIHVQISRCVRHSRRRAVMQTKNVLHARNDICLEKKKEEENNEKPLCIVVSDVILRLYAHGVNIITAL